MPPEEGIGYYTFNLSKKLKSRGNEVTIITRGGLRSETVEYDGITIRREPYFPVYPFHVDIHGFFVNRRLRRLESSPDIVHTHTPLTPVIDVEVPIVSTIHTSVVEDANQIDSFDPWALANRFVTHVSSKRIIKAQSEAATELATVARSVRDELDEHFGISDVRVVGNGVNVSEFDTEVEPAYEPFGLFVGRLSYRKGISDLLDAWESIPAEQRIPLKVVGKGPLQEQLEARIRQTDLENDIEFQGYVPRDEVIRLYKQATVFVVPSHYEGLPTVLLEAMAAETPVVSTGVSGALDVINDGENGLLVPPRDPESLRDAILELLDDFEYRATLAKRGRETIERDYTWEAVTDRYLTMYENWLEA